MVGLVLIVVFSLLAGASGSIVQIVGFRAGWGLSNALFIATSLAVIVGSASGGFAGAIVLYESALGIGIAIGPLLGADLSVFATLLVIMGMGTNVLWVLAAVPLLATVGRMLALPRPARPRPGRRPHLTDPDEAKQLAVTSAT